MYSWVPSVPPARRRAELGSSSLRGQGVCWMCAGGVLGVWEGRCSVLSAEAGGGAGEE